jgi:hypothetical protein
MNIVIQLEDISLLGPRSAFEFAFLKATEELSTEFARQFRASFPGAPLDPDQFTCRMQLDQQGLLVAMSYNEHVFHSAHVGVEVQRGEE